MKHPSSIRRIRSWSRTAAFTLVEMLAVISIVAIVLALFVPAFASLNKAGSLNSGGRLFVNLLTIARSQAIARCAVVRLEVATSWPSDPAFNYRKVAMTVATLNALGTAYNYQQIGNWETLPDGIIFEVNDPLQNSPAADGSVYLFSAGNAAPLGDGGSLPFAGSLVPTAYIAFSPTGALVEQQPPASQPVPIRARMVEGVLAGTTSITYTRRANGASTGYPGANWLDVRVNNLFGRIEVGRPDAPLP